jgi:hypothetical protein
VGVAGRVICISRTLGAGGEEVGWLVAERLGFAYVDELGEGPLATTDGGQFGEPLVRLLRPSTTRPRLPTRARA